MKIMKKLGVILLIFTIVLTIGNTKVFADVDVDAGTGGIPGGGSSSSSGGSGTSGGGSSSSSGSGTSGGGSSSSSGGGGTSSTEDILQGATDFINQGSGNSPINEDRLKEASDMIYNTLLAVGLVIAIIWTFYLGIKFMTGSVEEQAKVKESIKIFVVGCIVLFGAFGIWKLVLVLTKGIDDLSETSHITTVQIAEKL